MIKQTSHALLIVWTQSPDQRHRCTPPLGSCLRVGTSSFLLHVSSTDCNAAPSTLLPEPLAGASLRHCDHKAAHSINVRQRDCSVGQRGQVEPSTALHCNDHLSCRTSHMLLIFESLPVPVITRIGGKCRSATVGPRGCVVARGGVRQRVG
jgi:hypothetical protein